MKKTVRERYFNGECLSIIPKKEKNKLEVLEEIIKLFEKNRRYNEKEINGIGNKWNFKEFISGFCNFKTVFS